MNKPAKSPGYIRQYIADKDIGALHPSSRFLVRRLIRCLRPESIRTIVEFGPGPGVATRPLLDALPADARYIAIEKNPAFLEALESSVTDPRLTVVGGDACSVREVLSSHGIETADAIIASIPFSFLTRERRTRLIDDIGLLLADGGDFVIFHQFTPLILSTVKKRFPIVRLLFEPRNIMPCFLIHCRKKP
jgi:phospholipid N-methyltransferase